MNRAGIPQLVTITEAANILGVSRQRADQMMRNHPDFPEPVMLVGGRPVWLASEMQQFAETRRKSGPAETVTFVCPVCGVEATKRASTVRGNRKKHPGLDGPFCGRVCFGQHLSAKRRASR